MKNYKNINQILILIQIMLLSFVWIYTLIHFTSLPKIIPQHYGINGKPDIYGNKNSILILPILGSLLFILLNYLSRNTNSELLNISSKLKEKPNVARTFVNILLSIILLLFSVIVFDEIKVVKGLQEGLSSLVPILFILMLVFVVGFNLFFHRKKS